MKSLLSWRELVTRPELDVHALPGTGVQLEQDFLEGWTFVHAETPADLHQCVSAGEGDKTLHLPELEVPTAPGTSNGIPPESGPLNPLL
ncbi:hypothetical protein J6590_049383 [Homalodisca vitripennis]|nr:hypothetical protein J6590_049383 [Homalodisca vitripennis]